MCAQAKALGYLVLVVGSGLDETGRVRSGLSVQEGALVSKALYNVGLCHRRGVGTPVDLTLAYHHFAMAADRCTCRRVLCAVVRVRGTERRCVVGGAVGTRRRRI